MSMNIFRLIGDAMHAASILLLLHVVRCRRNASGISLKSQEYYLLVFVCRYLDLFTTFCSMYNSCMKIFFIASTGYVVSALRCANYRDKMEGDQDEENGGEEEGMGQQKLKQEQREQQQDEQEQGEGKGGEGGLGQRQHRDKMEGDQDEENGGEEEGMGQQQQEQREQQQDEQEQGEGKGEKGLGQRQQQKDEQDQQPRPDKLTYSTEIDDEVWPYTGVVLPSLLLLSFVVCCMSGEYYYFGPLVIFWTFSIMLEPVAMLPQLLIFRKNRHLPSHVNAFIALMGSYRLFYVFNWVYRSNTEPGYQHHCLLYLCGVIQVACYYDFAYYHARVWYQSEPRWGSSLSSTASSSATESAQQHEEEGGMSVTLLPSVARRDDESAAGGLAAAAEGNRQFSGDPDSKKEDSVI